MRKPRKDSDKKYESLNDHAFQIVVLFKLTSWSAFEVGTGIFDLVSKEGGYSMVVSVWMVLACNWNTVKITVF